MRKQVSSKKIKTAPLFIVSQNYMKPYIYDNLFFKHFRYNSILCYHQYSTRVMTYISIKSHIDSTPITGIHSVQGVLPEDKDQQT